MGTRIRGVTTHLGASCTRPRLVGVRLRRAVFRQAPCLGRGVKGALSRREATFVDGPLLPESSY